MKSIFKNFLCRRFATSHNLGISVFGTGHEFNDRNAGLEPNSLLIRYVHPEYFRNIDIIHLQQDNLPKFCRADLR